MRHLILVAALVFAPFASAAPAPQVDFKQSKGSVSYQYEITWREGNRNKQTVSFQLPAAEVKAEHSEITWFPRGIFNRAVAEEIRVWAATLDGVVVTVKTPKKKPMEVRISGTDSKAMKAAAKEIEQVQEDATDKWLIENDYTRLSDGSISYDHAGLVLKYVEAVAPIAAALRKGTASDREFLNHALSFVQAIPYEARKRNGSDPGLRRPLSVVAANRGDCDSKTLLFLAMVRAELPTLPLAVIYVPGHALGGVAFPAEDDDRTFEAEDIEFLYVEPVGPGLFPLGQPADDNKKSGKKGEVRIVWPAQESD